MAYQEIINKDGSVSIKVKVYRRTKERSQWTKTYPLPQSIKTKKAKQDFIKEKEVEYAKEVATLIEEQAERTAPVDRNVMFMDFALKWLKDIKRMSSKSYYARGRDAIKKFEKYFGNMKVREIKKTDIQIVFDDLCRTEVGKAYAQLKNLSLGIIESGYKKLNDFCNATGLTRTAIYYVRKGNRVEIETAEIICKALKIDIKKHFDVVSEAKHYSMETLKGYFRILRTILGHAEARGTIKNSPAYGKSVVKYMVKDVDEAVTKDKVFDVEESRQFESILLNSVSGVMEQLNRDIVNDDYYTIRQNIMFLIALHTGLRNGELCGLRWQDIDLAIRKLNVEKNVVYTTGFGVEIGKPKTANSVRTISLPNSLVEQLKKYKIWWEKEFGEIGSKCVETDFLFLNEKGSLIHPSSPAQWLRKMLKENGIKHLGMHGLRHTHATILIYSGVDIKTVSTRLGHKDPTTTLRIYTHFIPKGDEQAADKLDELFS